MEKYRSLDPGYEKFIIKEYTNWTLLLHDDQRYLGRAYAWLVREGEMQRLSELTEEEYAELRLVMREYETAMRDVWKPDHMNYTWLGNLFASHGGHGHLHIVPRYKEVRIFDGIEFIDGKWGKNLTPNEEFHPLDETLVRILKILRERISK